MSLMHILTTNKVSVFLGNSAEFWGWVGEWSVGTPPPPPLLPPYPISYYSDRYTYRYTYMYNVYVYDTHNV